MEAIIEISLTVSNKIDILEIYSTGEKIHNVINTCNENCTCIQYLRNLKNLLDTIDSIEGTDVQKIIFQDISFKNSNSFLLYDQINKKFGSEFFIMSDNVLKTAVSFEVEKIKTVS